MEAAFYLYLLTRLTILQDFFIAFTIMFGFASALLMMGYFISLGDFKKETSDRIRYYARNSLIGFFVSCVCAVITPSRNDLLIIVSGSTLYNIATTDRAKGVADNSLKVVEQWLHEQITEKDK